MKFKCNTKAARIASSGTCLQGHIDIGYDQLVAVLGQPDKGDEYKVDAEWDILFADGTAATIYNYKDGVNYMGIDGLPTSMIRDWHIGGSSPAAVRRVEELFQTQEQAA